MHDIAKSRGNLFVVFQTAIIIKVEFIVTARGELNKKRIPVRTWCQ